MSSRVARHMSSLLTKTHSFISEVNYKKELSIILNSVIVVILQCQRYSFKNPSVTIELPYWISYSDSVEVNAPYPKPLRPFPYQRTLTIDI